MQIRLPRFQDYVLDFECGDIWKVDAKKPLVRINMDSGEGQDLLEIFFSSDIGKDEYDRYCRECYVAGYDVPF